MRRTEWVDGCLVFQGARDRAGYGRVQVPPTALAHRVVYEHHHGPLPSEVLVLHSCDNPPCVNIDHLRPGTHAENAQDKVERGRQHRPAPRERCPQGHDLTLPDAVVTSVQADGITPKRLCRECRRLINRRRYEFHRDLGYCQRGHEWTPENTYMRPNDGKRMCRACQRARERKARRGN